MRSFEHVNASSVKEASRLLEEYKGKAVAIAGGTDLLSVLKDRILPSYPELLVNLKTIPGLDSIKKTSRGVSIGAMTRLADTAASSLISEEYPALARAAWSVGTPQLRNMGTIGGNLCQDVRCWYYRYPHHLGGRMICHRKGKGPCFALKGDNRYSAVVGTKTCYAVCPSDTATALAALDAEVRVAGPGGVRSVPVTDMYTPTGICLEPGEVVKEIRLGRLPQNARQSYLKFTSRKPVDFALVSVASVAAVKDGVCRKVSIALGGVAPGPFRAKAAEQILEGRPFDSKTIHEAADAALADARPFGKNGYKVALAKEIIIRALLALDRRGDAG
ncbi:MAG: FAD binding domain-containing protein [Desulfobacteraceae bacterium]